MPLVLFLKNVYIFKSLQYFVFQEITLFQKYFNDFLFIWDIDRIFNYKLISFYIAGRHARFKEILLFLFLVIFDKNANEKVI